jgi:hypothetical protein
MVYALIIVSFSEDFSSGGGTIVPTVMTITTRPSRTERPRDQALLLGCILDSAFSLFFDRDPYRNTGR